MPFPTRVSLDKGGVLVGNIGQTVGYKFVKVFVKGSFFAAYKVDTNWEKSEDVFKTGVNVTSMLDNLLHGDTRSWESLSKHYHVRWEAHLKSVSLIHFLLTLVK